MPCPERIRPAERGGGRRGFTTLEVIAAAGLVSAGLVSIVPVFVRQARLVTELRRERVALEELANQAERLAVVPPDELAGHLAGLAVSPVVTVLVPGARLAATRGDSPLGTRVMLALSWDAPGRDTRPLTLVTWLPPARAAGEGGR
jgi:hypothetical protein